MIYAMENTGRKIAKLTPIQVVLPGIAILVLAAWLLLTPDGLFGKADAVGYAICHRIPERSFWLPGRQMPLCARCSGMQLGSLAGFIYLFSKGRKGKLPPVRISVVLGLFFLAFALDGVNSYLNLVLGKTILYMPSNFLRLVTGTGVGIGIAALTVPIFNQTMWGDWVDVPSLPDFSALASLTVLAALVIPAVLSEVPVILYPLALLSAANVIGLLTIVYSILVVILLKKENKFQNIKELWIYLTAGFILAMLQISAMDALRYRFTGTWDGFHL